MRFTLISSVVGKLSAVKTSILTWGRGPAPLWVQDWPYHLGYARVSSSKRRQIAAQPANLPELPDVESIRRYLNDANISLDSLPAELSNMAALTQYVETSKASAVNAPSGKTSGSSVKAVAPFAPNPHSTNVETTTAVGLPLPRGSPFLLDSGILLPFMIGLLLALAFRFVSPDICTLAKLCHNGLTNLFEGCMFCWSFLKNAGPKGQEKESPQPDTSPPPPPVPLTLTFSTISTQDTTPADPSPVPPTFAFSPIFTQELVPIDPPDAEEEESEVIEEEEVLPCEEAVNVCHPCPKYPGQFHHQCKAHTTRSEDPQEPAAVELSVHQEQIEEAVNKALNKASDNVIQQVVDKVMPECKPDSADIAYLLKSPETMETLSRTVISNFKKDPSLSKLFHAEVNNTENIKKVLQLLTGMDDAEDSSIKAMLEHRRLDLITALVSMQSRVHQLPMPADSHLQPSISHLLEEISGEIRRLKMLRIKSPRSEQMLDKVQADIERFQEKVTYLEKLFLGGSRRTKTRRSYRRSPGLKDSSDDSSDFGDAPLPKGNGKTSSCAATSVFDFVLPGIVQRWGFHDGDFSSDDESSDDEDSMKPISAAEGLRGAAQALASIARPSAAPPFVPQPPTSFPSADEVYYAIPPCGIKLADLKEKFKGRIECYPRDRWYTIVDNSTSVSNKLRFRKKTHRPVMSPPPSPPLPQPEQPQWRHPDTGCRKRDCDFRDEHDCVGLTMTEEEYEEEERRRREILAAHKILKPKGHRRNGKMSLDVWRDPKDECTRMD